METTGTLNTCFATYKKCLKYWQWSNSKEKKLSSNGRTYKLELSTERNLNAELVYRAIVHQYENVMIRIQSSSVRCRIVNVIRHLTCITNLSNQSGNERSQADPDFEWHRMSRFQ